MCSSDPPAVVRTLNGAVVKIIRSEDMRQRLATLGCEPAGNSTEAFEQFVRSEVTRLANIVRESGARPD